MIMTILAVLAIAGGLQPLIRRDLKRAVVRQRWRRLRWGQVQMRDLRSIQDAINKMAKELARIYEQFGAGGAQ